MCVCSFPTVAGSAVSMAKVMGDEEARAHGAKNAESIIGFYAEGIKAKFLAKKKRRDSAQIR